MASSQSIQRGRQPNNQAIQHTVIRTILGEMMRNFRVHRRGTYTNSEEVREGFPKKVTSKSEIWDPCLSSSQLYPPKP